MKMKCPIRNATLLITLLLLCTCINLSLSYIIHTIPLNSFPKYSLNQNSSQLLASQSSSHTYHNIQLASTCKGGSDPDRPTKVNQDACFTRTNLANKGHLTLLGVMDGHGKQGHILNSFLSNRLPPIIEDKILSISGQYNNDDAELSPEEIIKLLTEAYENVNEEARLDPNVPAGRSGTTCVSCIFDAKNGLIHVANVGDSRGIIGLRDGNYKKWEVVKPLTIETTTKQEKERERIEAGEGRIDSQGNVWYGPVGIAMTRCLGNVVMHRANIIHTPVVKSFDINELALKCHLSEKDYSCLIVLGTDGIFDVLSNEEVVNIVEDCFQDTESLQSSSDALVVESKNRWQADLPFEVKVDDTTCVILRFDSKK